VSETTVQAPSSVKKEREEVLQAQEIPLQLVEKTMVKKAVPLQPMEVHGGADSHLQHVEYPTLEQVDAPKGGCDINGKPVLEQAPGRTCGPMESRFAVLCLPLLSILHLSD